MCSVQKARGIQQRELSPRSYQLYAAGEGQISSQAKRIINRKQYWYYEVASTRERRRLNALNPAVTCRPPANEQKGFARRPLYISPINGTHPINGTRQQRRVEQSTLEHSQKLPEECRQRTMTCLRKLCTTKRHTLIYPSWGHIRPVEGAIEVITRTLGR